MFLKFENLHQITSTTAIQYSLIPLLRTSRGPYKVSQDHIKQVEFRENLRAFFSQGQSKLSIIMGLYCWFLLK